MDPNSRNKIKKILGKINNDNVIYLMLIGDSGVVLTLSNFNVKLSPIEINLLIIYFNHKIIH